MILTIIIFLISLLFINTYKSKRNLHMMQQNLYNENNRYMKWQLKNNKFITIEIFTIVVSIISIFIKFESDLLKVLPLLVISIILLLEGLRYRKFILTDQNKKKLVITSRIKRLIFTNTILYLIPVVFLILYRHDYNICWILVLVISIMTYLNNLVVLIAMWINTPIEKLVYLYYKSKAQNKLKSMTNLKIIGITGSYGKTSSKNILSDILNIKYNALPTPKNLNTFNGLIMTVNNHMDKFTDIFIAEMGAYVKGEIKRLCKLVKPKYGILTKIGTAHLESFGSQENIQEGKFELIESLPSDGFGILNGDDPLQVSYKLKNNVRIIWIGIDNKDADVRATNIRCTSKGTTFDVVLKNDKKKYSFETKLLGNHNVYNILAGIACGIEFNIDMESLQKAVAGVKPIEHRLELKKIANFNMIDDAYNSNPTGAKRAIEVLKLMEGIKIVVTPGMIELGDKEDEYNKEFGTQIAEVADYVLLIGEKKTKPIKEGLLEKGFDKDKIIVFNDVREAYPFIGNIASQNKKEVYALFENDLPDTYNEK